jgi:mannose-6-phosphate isomerase-like protein (cupin superfamily)
VFEAAREYGLVLLQSGRLIDTRAGERVPADDPPMPPTSAADVARLREFDTAGITGCTIRRAAFRPALQGPFAHLSGVEECPLVGGASPAEGIEAGPLAWPHGFHVRALRLAAGAGIPPHSRDEAEVLLMHRGELRIRWPGGELRLGPGDTFTVPQRLVRHYDAVGSGPVELYVVRGGDRPAAPRFA